MGGGGDTGSGVMMMMGSGKCVKRGSAVVDVVLYLSKLAFPPLRVVHGEKTYWVSSGMSISHRRQSRQLRITGCMQTKGMIRSSFWFGH